MNRIDKVFKDLADLYELNRRIRKYRFKEKDGKNRNVAERKAEYPEKRSLDFELGAHETDELKKICREANRCFNQGDYTGTAAALKQIVEYAAITISMSKSATMNYTLECLTKNPPPLPSSMSYPDDWDNSALKICTCEDLNEQDFSEEEMLDFFYLIKFVIIPRNLPKWYIVDENGEKK